jgi:hypothetical protein
MRCLTAASAGCSLAKTGLRGEEVPTAEPQGRDTERVGLTSFSIHGVRGSVALSALALAAVALMPLEASAHFSTTIYSFKYQNYYGDPCYKRVDPMGLGFYGFSAYAQSHGYSHRVFDLLDGMRDPDHSWGGGSDSSQYASSHGYCTAMEYQANTGSAPRYHIRLNQLHDKDSGGRYNTVGTPHYEIGCNGTHAVPPDNRSTSNPDSGFDLGRGHIKNDWAYAYGGWRVSDIQYWGNTDTMAQPCNGWYSGSGGYFYWLWTD